MPTTMPTTLPHSDEGLPYYQACKRTQSLFTALQKRPLTLATAESCTGGLLAALLTELPGVSQYYLGGVCCYNTEMKSKLLGLAPEFIAHWGVVSAQVASAMAEAVRQLLGARVGLATTGLAGPTGALPGQPIGTVWCAVASAAGSDAFCLQLSGSRHTIRLQAVEKLWIHLINFLETQGAA